MEIKNLRTIITMVCGFLILTLFAIPAKASAAVIIDDDTYPISFNIMYNYKGHVKIHLRELDIKDNEYQYPNLYYEAYNINNLEKVEKEGFLTQSNNVVIENDWEKSGTYLYKIKIKELTGWKTIWEQKVFVVKQDDYTHPLTSSPTSRRELAAKYAPILSYFDDRKGNRERYYPMSLESLLKHDQPITFQSTFKSISHDESPIDIGDEYVVNNLKYLEKFLRFNGHKDKLIDFIPQSFPLRNITGSANDATSYYSIFEDSDRVYINYHFFYSFDEKLNIDGNIVPDDAASHNFDRESMTIVLNKEAQELKPENIVYGHHMSGQSIAYQYELEDKTWVSDRTWWADAVKVTWQKAYKYENHPIASIARGSHAVYPVVGRYLVDTGWGSALYYPEFAGVISYIRPEVRDLTSLFIPPALVGEIYQHNTSYTLKDLKLDQVDSDNVLAFSGQWVDGLSGDSEFPPFTQRESDVSAWVTRVTKYPDQAVEEFNMDLIPLKWKTINDQIKNYLNYKQVVEQVVVSLKTIPSQAEIGLKVGDMKTLDNLGVRVIAIYNTGEEVDVTTTANMFIEGNGSQVNALSDIAFVQEDNGIKYIRGVNRGNAILNIKLENSTIPSIKIPIRVYGLVSTTSQPNSLTISAGDDVRIAQDLGVRVTGLYEDDGASDITPYVIFFISSGENFAEVREVNGVYYLKGIAGGTATLQYTAWDGGQGLFITESIPLTIDGSFLNGIIADTTGNKITGVQIKANRGNESFTTTTASDGTYSLQLETGIYTIEVKSRGYISKIYENVEINYNETINQDIILEVLPSVQLTKPITLTQSSIGETFLNETLTVSYNGGTVWLAGSTDGEEDLWVDDGIELLVTHEDGTASVFSDDLKAGTISRIDITHLFNIGKNTVNLRLYDVHGGLIGSSALWITSVEKVAEVPSDLPIIINGLNNIPVFRTLKMGTWK